MLCKYPSQFRKVSSEAAFPCGQCLHCRVNQRRIWSHRIQIEAMNHPSSVFLTLTYSDENLPRTEFLHEKSGQIYSPLSVNPYTHRDFMKDLRYHYQAKYGERLRFYAVGEYGEKTQRPHYHYALFNFPACTGGAVITGRRFQPCRCPHCQFISKIWDRGHILSGSLNLDSANYISGYVTKKLTHDNNEYNQKLLFGRHPEFARMSRNGEGGIGAWATQNIANRLTQHGLIEKDDVPTVLVHGSKVLPLGRYLSDKLHEKMGHTFEDKEKLRKFEASLRSLFLSHKDISQIAPLYNSSVVDALNFVNGQKIIDRETLHRMKKKEPIL